MSWIKLPFVEYDISCIISDGFYISHHSKTINDFKFNKIIHVPFLLNKYFDLYKTEIGVINKTLYVYVYINYIELCNLILHHNLIPCRNDLFLLFKKNKNSFQFDKLKFQKEIKQLQPKSSTYINRTNIILTKCLYNDVIEYNDLIIDLTKQIFHWKKTYSKKLLCLNSSILLVNNRHFNYNHELFNSNNINKKILVVYDKELSRLKLFVFNHKAVLNITYKNYKNIKLSDFDKHKIIMIHSDLINKKTYYKSYLQFHSDDINYAYENYKLYIHNTYNRQINFHNVEIMHYDKVYFFGVLDQHKKEKKKKNICFFLEKLTTDKKIFIENLFNYEFNYVQYENMRDFIIPNKNISNDIMLNKLIIQNIFVENTFNITNYMETVNVQPLKFRSDYHWNLSTKIPVYGNTYLFEDILEKKKIKFQIKISLHHYHSFSIKRCPITYENIEKTMYVVLECQHLFSLLGFINYLCHNTQCPICKKTLIATSIDIVTNIKHMQNELLIREINHLEHNKINLIILNNLDHIKILNERYNLLGIKNVVFTNLKNLHSGNLQQINQYNNMNYYIFDYNNYNFLTKYRFYCISKQFHKSIDNLFLFRRRIFSNNNHLRYLTF